MKQIKYLALFLASAVLIPSCVEDTAPEDSYASAKNLVSFGSTSANFAAVADGNEYIKNVNMRVTGPSVSSMKETVTATVSVDPASTAIEGVHYVLESNTVTFSKENDYLNVLPVTMITDGIDAPLPSNPTLILNVATASGSDKVITNAKKITISLNYLCYEDLAGEYTVVIPIARCENATYGPNFPLDVEISANADGSWHLSSGDGGFLGWCTGNAGFANSGDIVVVCGEVQPSDNLEYGDSGIGNITGGTWDADNQVLTLTHVNTYTANWPATWTSVWTKK